ncbi:hypothetical protein BS50DRAFT_625213 [Corynespora cassiicola Philippines]|uniref:Kelch repeat protein-like protein n=1 Tax=Corynespora cassiicola Philippines TaxID=1448308 RepID=A0A2T2N9Y6_CORCC|nr:hypothetical protein BS50DRAFT_625213 [Corynespora cassiicola Philippines]
MRYHAKSLRTLVPVLLCHFVQCQKDPLNDFCRRFSHRTAVMNNKLYIDGGYVNWNPLSDNPENYTNEWLIYSDLETELRDIGMPKQFIVDTKQPPSLAGGNLWVDEINNMFYAFGGYFTSETPKPFETWVFDGVQNTWSNVTTQGDEVAYIAHGMSAVAPDAGIGYHLGGYQDETTDSKWSGPRRYVSEMVTFDMVTRQYSSLPGPDTLGRGEGNMLFIPASFAGLLIYFGGVSQDLQNNQVQHASMEEIWIYDIDLKKWYMQKATGDIPDNRSRFCSGITWADDKTSYNLYMYGGIDPDFQTPGFDDVYVLTMPAFVWIKMWPQADPGLNPHHSLTCNIINGTQMMVIGGYFPNTSVCDVPDVYGQHNVDLGMIEESGVLWEKFNHSNPPYRVPPRVVEVVGGTERGNANVTSPEGNITYDKYLFEKAYRVPQRYATVPWQPSTNSSVGTAGQNSGSSLKSSTLVGAIIGSVVGGVIIGVAGYYLMAFLRRRRAKSTAVGHVITASPEEPPHELGEDGARAEKMGSEICNELGREKDAQELAANPVELPSEIPIVRMRTITREIRN